MVIKRELERRLADLEARNRTAAPEDDDRERIELYFDGLYLHEPEPELTDGSARAASSSNATSVTMRMAERSC